MKNLIIYLLVATIGFMYLHRDSQKGYFEILRDYANNTVQFSKNLTDPAFRQLVAEDIRVKAGKVIEQDWDGLKQNLSDQKVSEELDKKEVTEVLSDFMSKGTEPPETKPAAENKRTRPSGAKEIVWEKTIAGALDKAEKNNQLVMIDFSTTWCGWCKKLHNETFRNQRVIDMVNNNFVSVMVDGDENPNLVRKYKVQGYPNLVFLSSDGRVIYQQPGYMPVKPFLSLLENVLDRA